MIVRLMGEGQFAASDDVLARLNELDERAQAAADAGNEPELDQVLDEMWQLVQSQGERLADDDLSASDVVIPPSDLTLEETKRLFSDEGLIPGPAELAAPRRTRLGLGLEIAHPARPAGHARMQDLTL